MQNVGGFLGKSLIIPLNVAVSEGLPPFGVLKLKDFSIHVFFKIGIGRPSTLRGIETFFE